MLENTSEVEVEMGGIIRYSLKHPNGLFSLPELLRTNGEVVWFSCK